MDVLAWSALVNRLYYGESFAAAKAFILANYVLPDTTSQTVAAAEIDANESSGADLTAVGAIPPEDRTPADASWYTLSSAYVTGLDNPAADSNIGDVYTIGGSGTPEWAAPTGSSLPAQTGHSGEFLTTDGVDASWDTVSGGGVDTMAAVGSSPSADGASIAGTTLTLQPADATHPGVVTTAVQAFGGAKTAPSFLGNVTPPDATAGAAIGAVSGFGGLWLSRTTPSGTNYSLLDAPTFGFFLNSNTSEPVEIRCNNVQMAQFSSSSKWLDLTGLGTPGAILLKDTLGATRTCTIDGTTGLWVIV